MEEAQRRGGVGKVDYLHSSLSSLETTEFHRESIEFCRRIMTGASCILAALPLNNKSGGAESIPATEMREIQRQLTTDCELLLKQVGERLQETQKEDRFSRSRHSIFIEVLYETCGTLNFHVKTFIGNLPSTNQLDSIFWGKSER